jgi:hypothetical protein
MRLWPAISAIAFRSIPRSAMSDRQVDACDGNGQPYGKAHLVSSDWAL